MSGHTELTGGRSFDRVEAGEQVFTDTSRASGSAPRWPVAEIERRGGLAADRVLFASEEPWGDAAGEALRLRAAAGDGDPAHRLFSGSSTQLYGST